MFLLPSLLSLPDGFLPFPLGLLLLLLVIFISTFATYRSCETQEKEKRNSYVSRMYGFPLPQHASRLVLHTTTPSVSTQFRIYIYSASRNSKIYLSRGKFNNTVLRAREKETGCVVGSAYETDKAAGKERDFGWDGEEEGVGGWCEGISRASRKLILLLSRCQFAILPLCLSSSLTLAQPPILSPIALVFAYLRCFPRVGKILWSPTSDAHLFVSILFSRSFVAN